MNFTGTLAADRETHPVQNRSPRTALCRPCDTVDTPVSDRTLSSGEIILWSAEPTLGHEVISLFRGSDFRDLATGFRCLSAPRRVELASDRNYTIE